MNNNTDALVARLEVLEAALGQTEKAQLQAELERLTAERAELVAEKGPLLEEANAMRAKVEASRLSLRATEEAHRRLQGSSGQAANRAAIVGEAIRQVDAEVEQIRKRLAELAELTGAPLIRNLTGRRS